MAERPMQEATFLILTALATGSQHGYGIITDVTQISGGRVRLRAGTLYTALDRLRSDDPDRGGPGRDRGQPPAALLPAVPPPAVLRSRPAARAWRLACGPDELRVR